MGADIPETEAKMPEQLRYLYDAFMTMRFSIIPNNEEFSRIARPPLAAYDIDFYSRNSGLHFHLWEVNAIMSLDSIFNRASQ